MGGSPSTPARTLTVDNPSGGGSPVAIHVSEAALQRAVDAAQRNDPSPPPPLHRQESTYIPQRAPSPTYDFSKEEEYWSKRIDALRKTHHSLNKKMEEEYDKAVSETAQMFQRAQTNAVVGKLPPCQKEKAMVLKCYSENPRQTLMCSQIVNTFNDCVSLRRSETAATGA